MNRIEEKMSALKAEGKKAFITYTTAGLPDMETTAKIMHAQQGGHRYYGAWSSIF